MNKKVEKNNQNNLNQQNQTEPKEELKTDLIEQAEKEPKKELESDLEKETKAEVKELGRKVSSFNKTYDKIAKFGLYFLTFLLPILFLPWTANVLDFNKQALLIITVFISFSAWMFKVLISGRINFKISLIHLPVIFLFLVYLLSAIFSLWPYGSFWGWPQPVSESLFSLLGLVLFYFLVVNIFEKKEIFNLLFVFSLSLFLAMLFGIFQLWGKFIFPIEFTKNSGFNTVGGVTSLAIFAVVSLPLFLFSLVSSEKKYQRVLFTLYLAVCTLLLILTNIWIAWWLVIIVGILIIVLGIQRRDSFDGRWLILPIFFLTLALLFTFFRFQIPGISSPSSEFFLKYKPSLEIVWQTLKTHLLLGTGPGTFVYDFSKYKDISFNQDPFWMIRFDWAGSKFLTIAATVGIFGILAFLFLIGFFIFYGFKFLINYKQTGDRFWLISIGAFVSFLTLTVSFFLYSSNLVLDFYYFLMLSVLTVNFVSNKKGFILKPSSFSTLSITLIFTLIFVFVLGVSILEIQRYVASVNYLQAAKLWQEGKTDESLKRLEKAVAIDSKNDFYLRELSSLYIQNINELSQKGDLSQEELRQKVQFYINNAVGTAKTATDLNSFNVNNWANRGFVYQSLIGLVNNSKDWALTCYERASELEPFNPYFLTQRGISLLKEAVNLTQDKKQEQEKLISEAEENFKKAIELKTDYAPALFQLAMVYQLRGEEEKMIEELEKAKTIAFSDVGIAFQLGLVYYQKNDFEKAKAELERAVSLNPNYANALYFLGLTYDKLNRRDDAIRVMERVVALNPNSSLATTVLNNLKTGEPALKGTVEEQPPEIPIKEEPEKQKEVKNNNSQETNKKSKK